MVFDATKQAGVRALVSSGWVGIFNAPLKLINDEMMTIGRLGRSFCPTAYLYTGKCPTRLAFRQRTRIGCSPPRGCRDYCHRFGQRPSYGCSAFLWRPRVLGWARLASFSSNHGADKFLFVDAGNMIYKSGAGPEPLPYKELTTEKLREAITFAISAKAKKAATDLAQKIHDEVNVIHHSRFTLDIKEFL